MTTQRTTPLAVLLAAVLTMAVDALPAAAGVILQTSADSHTATGGRVLDGEELNSGVSSASAISIGGLSRADSTASASGGSLSVFAQGGAIVYVPEDGSSGVSQNFASGFAHARFVIDDLVFSGPGEFLSRVSTRLGLALSGNLVVSGAAHKRDKLHSGVVSRANASLSGGIYSPQFGGLLSFSGGKGIELVNDTVADLFYITQTQDFGLLSGLDLYSTYGQHNLNTTRFDALLGVPLTFSLSLTVVGSSHLTGVDAVGSGVANFSKTLTLPSSAPVFDLPAGFTVNSAQAQIVNNRWVGGAVSSPVPEPSSLAIFGMGAGLMAIGAVRRRRLLVRCAASNGIATA